MKIIREGVVYVQRNDIMFLMQQLKEAVPAWLYVKTTETGAFICDDYNRFDFLSFRTPDAIDYFRGIDDVLDFDDVKDLTIKELNASTMRLIQEHDEESTKYNRLPQEERSKNHDFRIAVLLKGLKIHSLADFLAFRQGRLAIPFPKDVAIPPIAREDTLKTMIIKAIDRLKRH